MATISRRDLFGFLGMLGLNSRAMAEPAPADLHRQLLRLASRHEAMRRERFHQVRTPDDLGTLRRSLRDSFLAMIDGLPAPMGPPPVRQAGRLEGEGFVIEKFVFESLPGYFVSALLYRPPSGGPAAPAILSPCGHDPVGKANPTYQTLHINLARRGFVVLTYDPVGQGERSQYWDAARGRSRFDLSCGEHCVLGNPLYLLGTNLARYRIWDGIRALDHLASLPGVDPARIGCVGNSGGGTLTAYIAALDERIKVAVVGCYLTTLPLRMANRIQEDPSADPEQDPVGFVSRGIDHAGLLALLTPRPTLIAAAQGDFFPIAGTRATYEEARALYRVAGAEDRIGLVEAPGAHGLSRPLREAAYTWFDRWLAGPGGAHPRAEFAVTPRSPGDLRVCADGQVNQTYRSRPLLPLALAAFRSGGERPRCALKDLLRTDRDGVDYRLKDFAEGRRDAPLVLCLNGNEAPDWAAETGFLGAIAARGLSVKILDTRGVGALKVTVPSPGGRYADPLSGVEENLAYNAFLVGESLLAMRVADVRAAVSELSSGRGRRPIVLCGRRDAAMVACLAAAIEPRIARVAVEEMPVSLLPLFESDGVAVNAATILPGLLRDFGDIPDVLAELAPRPLLIAAPRGTLSRRQPTVEIASGRFSADPRVLLDWLG